MSAHNAALELARAQIEVTDPGNAGTISVDRSPCVVNLVSTAAETRTLARPDKEGVIVSLHMRTDGGDITLTVTGGYNEDADTSFTLSDVGQFVTFQGFMTSAGVYFWRKLTDYTIGNLDPADLVPLEAFSGLTATVAEINQWTDESAKTEVVITTNVITAAESGKTFFLDLVGGFTSTLPAPAAGLWFKFIVKTAPTTAYIITTNAGADILYGMMLERAGTAGVAGAARDTFNFVASQAIIGDWVEFHSDGTNWYYHGMVDVAAGNTVAAT